MTPSEAVTTRFLDAAGDLLREVFEAFERENPEQGSELRKRVAAGRPIMVVVLADRDGPLSFSVKAPGDAGDTVELGRVERVRRPEH
jgi:hypothetical protein